MMTASKLHLILDDLAAIKEFLPQLSASELTSLGTALVTLTNDARTAYKNAARQPASITQPHKSNVVSGVRYKNLNVHTSLHTHPVIHCIRADCSPVQAAIPAVL